MLIYLKHTNLNTRIFNADTYILFFSLPSTLKQLESLGLRCEQWPPMLECGVRSEFFNKQDVVKGF